MAKPSKNKTYQQMAEELSELVSWFEGEDIELDQAVAKYEQAMELLDQMEAYLTAAENKIKKINQRFDNE